ncbi:MAG: pyridoxal-phosphate dependent enzyme [Actinomycetota bacterium]
MSPLERLRALPRLGVGHWPTPLHRLDRFGAELGVEIWAKRDDVQGVALAGNKVRKFDLVVGDALARGCDSLVTTGAPQSNSARTGAAVAAANGFRCVLLLTGAEPDATKANLLLDRLLGAELRFVGDRSWRWLDEEVERVAAEIDAAGGRAVSAPVGCSSPLGSLGFALAFLELDEQLRDAGVAPSTIVHTSTSGGTHAGLLVGRALAGRTVRIVGVDVGGLHREPAAAIGALAAESAALIGLDLHISPDEIEITTDQIGDGYARPTPAGAAAIDSLARSEAVVTDPVYSGKGLAGLVDLVERRELDGPIVFWHTGGYHALFDPVHGDEQLSAGG